MLRKTLLLISRIFFNVMAAVLGLTIIAGVVMSNPAVESLLTEHVFKDKPEDIVVPSGKEPVRFKTWYSSIDDILEGNGEIAWLAQSEGTVLLKNEVVGDTGTKSLPLAAGTKVSLYGVTAYDPMYCLDGAGNNRINDPRAWNGRSEVDRRQFFYDEFEKVGFDMNEDLEAWYNGDGTHYRRRDYIGFWGLNGYGYTGNQNGVVPALTEATWSEIPDGVKDREEFGQNTTAVYITGRMANEQLDLNSEGDGSSGALSGHNDDGRKESTDYLAVTDEEKDLITNLGKNYDNVIVIFNQANPPQTDIPALLNECGVEAALWIGFPGSDGIKAVAEILAGEINPSGGLSAAWYTSRNANPSTQNFAESVSNVVNVEDVYVGYRYAETRYEDVILGSKNAGTYDYGANISYPFGYGLSYTTFSYSDVTVSADPDPAKNYYTGGLMAANDPNYTGNYGKKRPDGELRASGDDPGDCDDIIMSVKVTNTGSTPGKEIVQVYLQQPITQDDIDHGVQKPSVQLVGYGKTGILGQGESEVVQIEIDANKWFAAYDSRASFEGGQGGYVLAAGDYYLAAARNSHEAVNSILRAKNADVSGLDPEYGAGNAANVAKVTVDAARSASYKYWTQGTTDEVHNLFTDIDPAMNEGGSAVTYFSRYEWEKTAAAQSNGRLGQHAASVTGGAKNRTNGFDSTGKLNSSNIDSFASYYGVEFDSTPYTFGSRSSVSQESDEWLNLVDLIGVEYDPARGATEEDVRKWHDLVAQMTRDDMDRLFSQGLRKTLSVPSIGKPGTNDQNASNGFEWAFAKGDGDHSGDFRGKNAAYGFMNKFYPSSDIAYPTGYPCEGIRAATFNNYIAELIGNAMGEDGLWGGTSGVYGFGLGLQRNPYHGRAGEFYSDDPFLTGMIGGYETKGAQEKGLYVYNKHFVLNDQDTNRNGYSAWISEQNLRQVYLRPFEMAIEIGDAMNVMIAFNELGDSWTGSSYNLMTRWLRGEAGMAGFAISDYAPAEGENLGYGVLAGACLLDGDTSAGYSAGVDARYDNRLVEAAIRILYTVANSNAMNFWGEGTVTYSFDPPWYGTRDALVVTACVIFGVSCLWFVGMTAWDALAKKRAASKAAK